MIFVGKNINLIFRKIKTILILISFKCFFSHPEKSILKSSLTLRRHCNSGPCSTKYLESGVVTVDKQAALNHTL